MTKSDFHEFTPREFFNALKGFRKMQDAESRERYVLARFTAWASMRPHMKNSFKETDLIEFPWEKETVRKIKLKNEQEAQEALQECVSYWERIDAIREKQKNKKTDC